jgi:FkbM family methyltransferase
MCSYLNDCFTKFIRNEKINTIFELGSRDVKDAIELYKHFNCKVYAFECNPDCLIHCKKNLQEASNVINDNIYLVETAVSLENQDVTFYPFDLTKYNNMGSSSMYKIDFSFRDINDPDYRRENPQKEITVKGKRLDTFMEENDLQSVDLLCIDLQGYELNALKSLGHKLKNVKYIITESSIVSTYIGGATFVELNKFLSDNGFIYVSSNQFGQSFPDTRLKGFSEFDVLFVHKDLL